MTCPHHPPDATCGDCRPGSDDYEPPITVEHALMVAWSQGAHAVRRHGSVEAIAHQIPDVQALIARLAPPVVCPDCGGHGRLPCPELKVLPGDGEHVNVLHPEPCEACGGARDTVCGACNGHGAVWGGITEICPRISDPGSECLVCDAEEHHG